MISQSLSTDPDASRYPALAACIGHSRAPSRDQIRTVARRTWREGFASEPQATKVGFGARRVLVLAAKIALYGSARN